MTSIIPLPRGYVTIVDDADFERVIAFKWHLRIRQGQRPQVIRSIVLPGSTRAKKRIGHIYLYRFIIDAPPRQGIDHVNGDTLDNRRSNLRFCTQRENNFNKGPRGPLPKGVTKKGNRYRARIGFDGTHVRLGYFATPEEAGRAYDAAAKQHHGAFARLNFPDGHSVPPRNKEDGTCISIQAPDNQTPSNGVAA